MWPFTRQKPCTDLCALTEARLQALEADNKALRAELVAWEARATKLAKELSRSLKSLAEVERREHLRQQDQADLEPEEEDLDLVQRTLRFGKGA